MVVMELPIIVRFFFLLQYFPKEKWKWKTEDTQYIFLFIITMWMMMMLMSVRRWVVLSKGVKGEDCYTQTTESSPCIGGALHRQQFFVRCFFLTFSLLLL